MLVMQWSRARARVEQVALPHQLREALVPPKPPPPPATLQGAASCEVFGRPCIQPCSPMYLSGEDELSGQNDNNRRR